MFVIQTLLLLIGAANSIIHVSVQTLRNQKLQYKNVNIRRFPISLKMTETYKMPDIHQDPESYTLLVIPIVGLFMCLIALYSLGQEAGNRKPPRAKISTYSTPGLTPNSPKDAPRLTVQHSDFNERITELSSEVEQAKSKMENDLSDLEDGLIEAVKRSRSESRGEYKAADEKIEEVGRVLGRLIDFVNDLQSAVGGLQDDVETVYNSCFLKEGLLDAEHTDKDEKEGEGGEEEGEDGEGGGGGEEEDDAGDVAQDVYSGNGERRYVYLDDPEVPRFGTNLATTTYTSSDEASPVPIRRVPRHRTRQHDRRSRRPQTPGPSTFHNSETDDENEQYGDSQACMAAKELEAQLAGMRSFYGMLESATGASRYAPIGLRYDRP
ncbi:hypothetical protein CC80DRAFT_550676 [Byssothecium circinans]|uniref:Peroxin-14 n=1 Tax=Byssothecium circinans TaxID=147558 RepID=A0A6A5TZ45_9PLEO|nr:hypothetical protein CC80DRAFT_550676 [Byssothecium circinans]